MDRPDPLLALAQRCEAAACPDRALDADIYEALGFSVRRKPSHLVTRRAPAGGIYREGAAWKAIGAASAEIDVVVGLLTRKASHWSWSLHCVADKDRAAFKAAVAGHDGHGATGALALCAAMLRAFGYHEGVLRSRTAPRR